MSSPIIDSRNSLREGKRTSLCSTRPLVTVFHAPLSGVCSAVVLLLLSLVLLPSATSVFPSFGNDGSLNNDSDNISTSHFSSSNTPLFSRNQQADQTELDQNQQGQTATTTGFISYENPNNGFSLAYPSDWIKAETLMQQFYEYGTLALEIAPPNSPTIPINTDDDDDNDLVDYETSFNVWMTTKYEEGQSIEEYLEDMIKDHDDNREDNNVIESNPNINLGGRPGYLLIDESGGEEDLKMKILKIGTFLNDKVVEVEYLTPPQNYDKYLPIVNQIISSFRFISDQQTDNLINQPQEIGGGGNLPPTSPPSQPPPNDGQGGGDVGFGGTPIDPDEGEGESANAPSKPKF